MKIFEAASDADEMRVRVPIEAGADVNKAGTTNGNTYLYLKSKLFQRSLTLVPFSFPSPRSPPTSPPARGAGRAARGGMCHTDRCGRRRGAQPPSAVLVLRKGITVCPAHCGAVVGGSVRACTPQHIARP